MTQKSSKYIHVLCFNYSLTHQHKAGCVHNFCLLSYKQDVFVILVLE